MPELVETAPRAQPSSALQYRVKMYDVDILCGYSLGSVEGGMDDHVFRQICAEQSVVRITEP